LFQHELGKWRPSRAAEGGALPCVAAASLAVVDAAVWRLGSILKQPLLQADALATSPPLPKLQAWLSCGPASSQCQEFSAAFHGKPVVHVVGWLWATEEKVAISFPPGRVGLPYPHCLFSSSELCGNVSTSSPGRHSSEPLLWPGRRLCRVHTVI
jgi:hypothetical protein